MTKVVFVTKKKSPAKHKRYVLEAWNGGRWADTGESYATLLGAKSAAQGWVDVGLFELVRVVDTKE